VEKVDYSLATYAIFRKLLKVNNHPISENPGRPVGLMGAYMNVPGLPDFS
jgi:hypothetical protein